jgi:hypothetical protein
MDLISKLLSTHPAVKFGFWLIVVPLVVSIIISALVVLPINPPAVTHKLAPHAHRQWPRIQGCSQETISPVVTHKFAS